MDQTGMEEKPVEDAWCRHGTQRVEAVLMTPAMRLELAGSLKRRVEDVNIRVPKSTAIRHGPARCQAGGGADRGAAAGGHRGHPRARRPGSGRAAMACGAAETEPVVYELHRIDNHADLRGRPNLGRSGGVRWRAMPRAL